MHLGDQLSDPERHHQQCINAETYLYKMQFLGNINGHRNCNLLSIFTVVSFNNIDNNLERVLFCAVQHHS